MFNSENNLQKMMTFSDKSKASLKYSLKNKPKKPQKVQPMNQNHNNYPKTMGNSSIYKPYEKTKDKITNQTDHFASYMDDQSIFNCLETSKAVLKFNQHTQISVNENQFRKHNKQNSEFSVYSSKLNLHKYNSKPISQQKFGGLSNQQSHISYIRGVDSCTLVNSNNDKFLTTEMNDKFSLKKRDNFQLKIKSHCYPCFKYADLLMPIKKITKDQLRQLEDFKYLVYKNQKENKLSKVLCSNFNNKMSVQEGCQCFPRCLWMNRWIDISNQQKQSKNFLSNSTIHSNYGEIVKQIQKDIPRTQINNSFLASSINKQKLRQVLQSYAKLDSHVGYVQGMNIIASIVIYHSICSASAYEVFWHLMQTAGLRKIYLNDLSFAQQLNKELMKQLRSISFDLYNHLNGQSIDINAFTCSWYFSLMGIFIPLEYMHLVIDKFFRKSWSGINEIIITILLYKRQELMSKYDQQLFECFSIKALQQKSTEIDWRDLFVRSENLFLTKITI